MDPQDRTATLRTLDADLVAMIAVADALEDSLLGVLLCEAHAQVVAVHTALVTAPPPFGAADR